MKVKKQQDEAARQIEFGVEIETQIPAASGVAVGNYHGGNPVYSGLAANGERVNAPNFEGRAWMAERDGSITCDPGYIPCEFVSPVLKGEQGIATLREMIAFINRIGGKVNKSCGCHVTIGIKSVVGAVDPQAVALFLKKLAHVGNRHAWALYAQTGTDRHTNHYAHQLRPETGNLVDRMTNTADAITLSTLASQCGRGMINLQKAFRGERGCVEFRAFAGTLNEAKVLHHVASAFAIVRRAHIVNERNVGRFDRRATTKHSKVKNAVEAVRKLWRVMGWCNAGAGRDCALGLFGALHAEFGTFRKTALKMAEQFEERFPNANL